MHKSVVLALAVAGCGVDVVTTVDDLPSDLRAKAPEQVWTDLAARQERTFIVALQPTVTDSAMRDDHKARLLAAAPPAELVLDRDWSELPLVQVHATTLEAAVAVLERDEAAAAYDIEHYELTDAQSFPLIEQPAAAAAGKTGTGTAVAVLDTGTDYTRTDFGSCSSPGVPAGCKVAFAADFAPSDNTLDDNGHGTNVAGIVVGVAPGAKVLALDVFTGGSASSTNIISAINWAITNKATYNIASMNLSLGGGASTTTCAADPMGIALGSARSAGIAPVVASGNSAMTNAISSPACAPAAISVGAVYDANVGGLGFSNCSDPTTAADRVTCFSNSASFLSVLAPGALITAAGYTMAGTSQAAPHVAGAFAVLRGAFPAETVDQQLARLTSTGKQIVDPRNGISKPRINLAAALASNPADTTPPTGTVKINAGATTTRTAAVTLAITGSDTSGMGQMCVTNTNTCTAFEVFATTKAWTLAAGDGNKTVTVVLRDKVGNTTAATSPKASIILDATLPTNGTATATAGNKSVALAWTGFADASSGIASYRVVAATGASAPATCTGATVYTGTATTFTATGLVNGTAVSYRVCALDRAGNLSTGATASATPHEMTAPTGTLVINGGAATTRVLALDLALAATDDTAVAQMCISATATCTAFVAYATARTFTLAAGDGVRTVRVWYRDTFGNTSAPIAASIRVDTTAPTGGLLAATAGAARINLSWTAASDAGSGVAGYRLVGAAGTTPPAAGCTTGLGIYLGTATSYSHAVTSSATWSYRLCPVDLAGNIAAGTTKTIKANAALSSASIAMRSR